MATAEKTRVSVPLHPNPNIVGNGEGNKKNLAADIKAVREELEKNYPNERS